jgi:hypothetical protein
MEVEALYKDGDRIYIYTKIRPLAKPFGARRNLYPPWAGLSSYDGLSSHRKKIAIITGNNFQANERIKNEL